LKEKTKNRPKNKIRLRISQITMVCIGAPIIFIFLYMSLFFVAGIHESNLASAIEPPQYPNSKFIHGYKHCASAGCRNGKVYCSADDIQIVAEYLDEFDNNSKPTASNNTDVYYVDFIQPDRLMEIFEEMFEGEWGAPYLSIQLRQINKEFTHEQCVKGTLITTEVFRYLP